MLYKVNFLKTKKAISPMIAYIILITIVLAISPFVYSWLKSYVNPGTVPECPGDISILIENASCYMDNSDPIVQRLVLGLKLQNNGLFDIDGYSLKATTSETQELATLDLSAYYGGDSKQVGSGTIMHKITIDPPLNIRQYFFNLTGYPTVPDKNKPKITSIEVTPRKIVKIEGREKWTNCDNARIKQNIICKIT
ncbi:MAG: hypothetical protein AABX30_03095 [Nanoarchaeota archaeon]